ncbi:MAG: aromatic amino acid ammonia-lyase [Spirochaetota bacterium]|nr:aromatic amino acid ammonia-lyase [Spirochaetota bacterium]
MEQTAIKIDNNYKITLEDFERITRGNYKIELSDNKEYISYINRGNEIIRETIKRHVPIYGVNTGFGDSCRNQIYYSYAKSLQENLVKFHGCGVGPYFSEAESHGMILLRLISNSKGHSGVTYMLLKQLERYINVPILPVIPELGSVGASGDLTPLSYIAATLMGSRKVYYKGKIVKTQEALDKENIKALVFEPKEALAILNGTSVMTAVSAYATIDAKKIIRLTELTTALAIEALKGNKGSLSDFNHQAKPHLGQIKTARTIKNYLSTSKMAKTQDEINLDVYSPDLDEKSNVLLERTIQDKYSLRCTPQIIGVLWDIMTWLEDWVTIEMNSANDNPLVDVEHVTIYNGGNFYGGHICQGMDSLRAGLANLADLIDKQIELLVDEKFSNGLPANLIHPDEEHHFVYHGFKAMQICCTALTVEIHSQAQPVSILSRPTESLNQDKVSLGTISARHTRNVIRLMENILAIHLLALCQAIELRGSHQFSHCAKDILNEIRKLVPFVDKDREMDEDIQKIVSLIGTNILTDIMDKYNKNID